MGDKKEDPFSKRALLQLLESEYKDEGCQILFNAISALPTHDPKVLLHHLTAVSRAQSHTVSNDEWYRAVCYFDLEVTICVHQIVRDIMLRELRPLSSHIKYWKNSLQSPVSHFLVNGQLDWLRHRPRGLEWSGLLMSVIPFMGTGSQWYRYLARMQRADVKEKLDRLDLCEQSFTLQAGHLHHWIGIMEKQTTFAGQDPTRMWHGYVSQLLFFVSNERIDETKDPFQLVTMLADILKALPEFESWFVTQLEPYRKPSHVRRHWVGYTLLGAGTLFAANKVYNNWTPLAAWGRQTGSSFTGFMHSHVTEPVSTLYSSVFDTFRDRQLLQANRNSLAESRASLTTMLHDFGGAVAKENAAREGKSMQQYMTELPNRAAGGDMTLVMPNYEKNMRTPIRSASELVPGLLIQVQKLKVDTEASMLAMDQVLKSNEINFSILALVPAVLLTSFVLLGIKRWIFRRPSRTDLHRRMRCCLRRVESILIQNYGANRPVLDDHSTGLMLLYLQKLESHVRTGLNGAEQKDILADIQQLRSVDLDVQQKHLMIARMYRAYTMDDKRGL